MVHSVFDMLKPTISFERKPSGMRNDLNFLCLVQIYTIKLLIPLMRKSELFSKPKDYWKKVKEYYRNVNYIPKQ